MECNITNLQTGQEAQVLLMVQEVEKPLQAMARFMKG